MPRFPGVTSALDCVTADIRHDQVQTVNLPLAGIDAASLNRCMVEEAAAARAVVESAGLSVERTDLVFELDMHYIGQIHTVAVPLPVSVANGTTGVDEATIRAAFERAYQASFSRLLPGVGAKIVNPRTAAIGRRPHFDLAALAPAAGTTVEGAYAGARPVWFDGAWHETAVYNRLDLPAGAHIQGPAILEQPDATTVIDPDLSARVDGYGNVIVEWSAR